MNFFCQHVFLFCATLKIFSQYESLFLVSHNAIVATTYFFVTHLILVVNITSM